MEIDLLIGGQGGVYPFLLAIDGIETGGEIVIGTGMIMVGIIIMDTMAIHGATDITTIIGVLHHISIVEMSSLTALDRANHEVLCEEEDILEIHL